MIVTKLPTNEESDWELFDYILDLEEEWRNFLPRFTDKELLEIFPEAKKVIPEKIAELEEKRKEIAEVIKKKLTIIKHKSASENQWFWREVVKVWEGQELLKVDGYIAKLKRLLLIARGKVPKGQLTEEEIQQALAVPIETILNQPLRKSGKAFVGLCPFHNEKHPSFYIYPETNSCWCYGCNQGGDVINFVRLLHGYSFKEAVQYLIGEK